jgi:PEP-CTERM motif
MQMSKWYRSILLSLPVLLGLSTGAHAGVMYFTYAYTGNGIASAGLLTTTDVAVGGAYTITDITGTRNTDDISGLLAPGAFGGNDNQLYSSGPFVDVPGFSYTSAGLSYNVANANLGCGSASQYLESANGFCPGTGISMIVTPFDPAAGSAYFAFSYVGDGIASAGILTATNAPVDGAYTITGIQGLRNDTAISGLLAPGAFGGNDNQLYYPSGPFVDVPGFSYAAGGLGYNVANGADGCGSTSQYLESATGFCPGTNVGLNVVAISVPEPASLALFGIGLVGLGFSMRRKAVKA